MFSCLAHFFHSLIIKFIFRQCDFKPVTPVAARTFAYIFFPAGLWSNSLQTKVLALHFGRLLTCAGLRCGLRSYFVRAPLVGLAPAHIPHARPPARVVARSRQAFFRGNDKNSRSRFAKLHKGKSMQPALICGLFRETRKLMQHLRQFYVSQNTNLRLEKSQIGKKSKRNLEKS